MAPPRVSSRSQATAWAREPGLSDLVVAVNLSAVHFKRGNLEQSVIAALEESCLAPDRLELELTESVLIHDTDKVLATVQRLKALGVMLSIDDFGTGYSSLSYLTRFKVDKLKIDRSFVCDLENQPGNASMVRAIIQMARSLNLTTIAEGVEDLELVNFLRRQNCQEAQGYYYSRPLAAIEFAHYLALARAHTGVRAVDAGVLDALQLQLGDALLGGHVPAADGDVKQQQGRQRAPAMQQMQCRATGVAQQRRRADRDEWIEGAKAGGGG